MPKNLTLLLPLLYAVTGGLLWHSYGAGWTGIAVWVVLQIFVVIVYRWLIADRSLGLMLKFHLVSTGLGMILLFIVLFPGRSQASTSELVLEFIFMGLGTFCCAIGLFSLLYMATRKLISDHRTDHQ